MATNVHFDLKKYVNEELDRLKSENDLGRLTVDMRDKSLKMIQEVIYGYIDQKLQNNSQLRFLVTDYTRVLPAVIAQTLSPTALAWRDWWERFIIEWHRYGFPSFEDFSKAVNNFFDPYIALRIQKDGRFTNLSIKLKQ